MLFSCSLLDSNMFFFSCRFSFFTYFAGYTVFFSSQTSLWRKEWLKTCSPLFCCYLLVGYCCLGNIDVGVNCRLLK